MSLRSVQDLMTKDVVAVRASDNLATARELLESRHIRHLPVVDDEGTVVGLVSQRDLLRSALSDRTEMPIILQEDLLRHMQVGEVMTRDVDTVGPDTPLDDAADVMLEGKYGCLPVVEDERLVGILTEADFVRHVAAMCEEP